MNIYRSNCENFAGVRTAEAREMAAAQAGAACGRHDAEGTFPAVSPASLKCGTPFTTTIPSATEVGTTFNVANLNVDTSKFHDPCIRFEFAGNILTGAGTATLNFQVFKQCKYQPVAFPVGPVWTFSRLTATAAENNVFMFPVCDCDVCEKECCNYSVVATVEALDVQTDIVISNAALAALVVDSSAC